MVVSDSFSSSSHRIVVMGVSSCGKSEIGERLAAKIGGRFVDGDDYHPQANVDKMARGEPLDDQDRAGWLETLSGLLAKAKADDETLVIGCSALKRRYRDTLRQGDSGLAFVFLEGSKELLLERIKGRKGHFFKGESMLDSQLETLEPPTSDEAVTIDIALPIPEVVDQADEKLRDFFAS